MIISLNDFRFFVKEMTIREDTPFYRKFTPGTKIQKYFKAQAGGWKDRPKDIDGKPIYKIGEAVVTGNFWIRIERGCTNKLICGDAVHIEGKNNAMKKIFTESIQGDGNLVLIEKNLFKLSKLECFSSWKEMKNYFRLDKIGTFTGRLILFKNIDYKPIMQRCVICQKADEIHLLERLPMGISFEAKVPLPDLYFHWRCAKCL